ncbi:MAG TPA: hypothetical protein VLA45_20675 [Paracoccaceae bacterium]|nr:hypothetical protein [Paracoccaceae bacterium]
MKANRPRLIGGVVATALAWGCFAMMDTVPDYSDTQNALSTGGYILVGVALFLFVSAMRKRG